jgi:hypothetical protein
MRALNPWIKRALKAAGVIAAFAAVLAGFLTWALPHYLPPERLRELVTAQARKSLGREVSLGRITVSLLNGVVIEQLAVSERPDFKAGRFAEVGAFSLRLRLLPLLRRKVVVDRVEAVNLSVNVIRRADGGFNFSDLSTPAAPGNGAAAAPSQAVSLYVKRASLRSGHIAYRDEANGQNWALNVASAKISDFRQDGPFSADVQLSAEGRLAGKTVRPNLDFVGKVNLGGGQPQRMSAVIKQMRLEESGRELRLSGKIFGLATPKFDVTAEFSSAGRELLSAQAEGSASSLAPRPAGEARLKLRTSGFDARQIRAAGLPADFLPADIAVPETSVEGRVALSGEQARLDKVIAKTALGEAEISGRCDKIYSGRPEPDLEVALSLALPQLESSSAPWLKLPAGLSLPKTSAEAKFKIKAWEANFQSLKIANVAGKIEGSGSVADLLGRPRPRALRLKSALALPALSASDAPWLKLPPGLRLPASSIEGEAQLDDWNVKLLSLLVKAAGARVEASGEFTDLLGKPRVQTLKAKAHLELPQWRSDQAPWTKLPPKLSVPAMTLDSDLGFDGEALTLNSLRAQLKAGEVTAKGVVRKALSEAPQPDLEISARLDLPDFVSADLPFAAVPAGLAVPASRLEAQATGTLDDLNIRRARLIMGKNDLEVSGTIKGRRGPSPALDILLKCRSFLLEELTGISPQTRDLKLSGGGFFALGVAGPMSKPAFRGKAQFRGLGANVAQLPLSEFTGTASFDENRVDIPDLRGKVADGNLDMDLTVRNYRSNPAVELQGSLDRFDLGRYLAAKAAWTASQGGKGAKNQAQPQGKPASPLCAKGRFSIGELRHPNMTAKDVRLNWDLEGITPDLKVLDGWAKLAVAGGSLRNIGKMTLQSVIVKILTSPIVVLQKISVGSIRIFPNLDLIPFTEIAGDYSFVKGFMTLKDTHLYSEEVQVDSSGTIDLTSERLNLLVTAQVGRLAPIDIKVTGTFEKPSAKPQIGKFLADPAKDLLNKILKKN